MTPRPIRPPSRRRVTECHVCHKPLSGKLDTWGEHAVPLCWDCYAEILTDGEEESRAEWPIECEVCHAPRSAYHKASAGYPGLYHCIACGAWIDKTTNEAWNYRA